MAPRRAARVLAALGVAALSCVLALELGVKLYLFGWRASPKELLAPSDDPELIYELAAGVRGEYAYLNPHQRDWPWTASVNRHGFRGAAPARGDEAPRVLVLGDSYAFGYGVDDEDTFAHQLGRRLAGASVLNFGVPGYDLVQQARRLERDAGAWSPAAVVLALHPNDLEPPVFEDADQLRWVRRSHLYAAWLHLRFVGEDVYATMAASLPSRRRLAEAALERVRRTAAERGAALLLFQASCWSGPDDAAFRALLQHAATRGMESVPADPRFCARLTAESIPNDGHPTRRGHSVLADRLEPRLRALLRDAPTLPGDAGPRAQHPPALGR